MYDTHILCITFREKTLILYETMVYKRRWHPQRFHSFRLWFIFRLWLLAAGSLFPFFSSSFCVSFIALFFMLKSRGGDGKHQAPQTNGDGSKKKMVDRKRCFVFDYINRSNKNNRVLLHYISMLAKRKPLAGNCGGGRPVFFFLFYTYFGLWDERSTA